MNRRLSGRLIAVPVAAILLTGCARLEAFQETHASSSHGSMTTLAQAAARAMQILQDTAAAMSPRPRLDFDPALPNEAGICITDTADAAQTVSVSRTAWLREAPGSRNASLGRQVLAFWREEGFQILTYSGFSAGQATIDAQTGDYFTIDFVTTAGGQVSIGDSSPCIYRNGTPPP